MSQLDISIFYSHLFGLLLVLYIFSHFMILILSTNYYNSKLRNLEIRNEKLDVEKVNNINTLLRILD